MASERRPVLYQFGISHFCEKARWCLDHKGIACEVRDVLPGAHMLLAKRLGARRTVPILVDGGRVLDDSTDIALHLERTRPAPALLPADGPARDRVLELEAYFDDVLGPDLRRYLYGLLLATPGSAAAALFSFHSAPARLVGRLAAPVLEGALRRTYQITPESTERSRRRVLEAVDRIDRALDGDAERYLGGGALTLADIAGASLLGPLLRPAGSPWAALELPAGARELEAEVRSRPAGRWALARYARDRRGAKASS